MTCAVPAKQYDAPSRRALIELQYAWLRLALAGNEIRWAQQLLLDGNINPEGALRLLDEAMEDIAGVRP